MNESVVMLFNLNFQDPASSFQLISDYTGKPVGVPPDLESLTKLGQVTLFSSTYLSVSTAVSVGFAAFGSFRLSTNHKVWTSDYGSFANQADLDPSNGIDSWTYGVGYRVGILMETSEGGLKAGLPVFAAEATLNGVNTLIQIITYGLPDAPAPPVADLSSFDVEAYAKYISWQTAVHNYIKADRENLMPVLTHASFTPSYERYRDRLLPFLYALRRLEDKHTFKQAVEFAMSRYGVVDVPVLRMVYAKCTGNNEYLREGASAEVAVIPEEAKEYAKKVIEYYNCI